MKDPIDEPPLEASAAFSLARMVDQRTEGWTKYSSGDGHWRWTDPDEDYGGRYIEVDGRLRDYVPVGEPMRGKHMGPQILGYCSKVTVFVVLPHVVDRGDLRNALEALEAIDAIPIEEQP